MCQNLSPVQAWNMVRSNQALLIDVRTPAEYYQGYIPGANLIPLNQLPYVVNQLPRDKTLLLYCRSGHRSGNACEYLSRLGFRNVAHIHGGIISWIRQGLPVEGTQQSFGFSRWGRKLI